MSRKNKIGLVVLSLLINTFGMSAMYQNHNVIGHSKKRKLNLVNIKKIDEFTNLYGSSREDCVNFLIGDEMSQATLNAMHDNAVVHLDAENREVIFVGDLHTSLNSLKALESSFLEEKLARNEAIVVFTGDYADPKVYVQGEGGGHSAEDGSSWESLNPSDNCTGSYATVCYIAHLKASYPENVVLLRGNHESTEYLGGIGLSWLSGEQRIGHLAPGYADCDSQMAIDNLRIFYKSLPFGVEIISGGKRIVAFHGCLPRYHYYSYLDLNLDNYRFENVDCAVEGKNSRSKEDNAVVELLWNDIEWDNQDVDNSRGIGVKSLKKYELGNIMERLDISYFVHGHYHIEKSKKKVSEGRESICVISFDPCQQQYGIEGARVVKFKNGVPEIIYREDWVKKI